MAIEIVEMRSQNTIKTGQKCFPRFLENCSRFAFVMGFCRNENASIHCINTENNNSYVFTV